MKPSIQYIRRCSCTSYSNGTDTERSSLRSMVLHGSRIDKLYANKYVPLRERRLLAKLAKTRAIYDNVRLRIMSSNDNVEGRDSDDNTVLDLVDMIDRGIVTGGRGISHCSCCSCSSDIRDENFGKGHRIRGYLSSKSSVWANKLTAKKKRSKKLGQNVTKQIRSDPCTCTCRRGGSKNSSRRSQTVIEGTMRGLEEKQTRSRIERKRYKEKETADVLNEDLIKKRSKINKDSGMYSIEKFEGKDSVEHKKNQAKNKARTKVKSSTASLKIMNSTNRRSKMAAKKSFNIIKSSCECFVKGAKRLRHNINKNYSVEQNKQIGFPTNDSLEKHRNQLHKKQMTMYCPFECNEDICSPEECLNKINLRNNHLQKKQMAMYCPFECNEDICSPEECLNKINLRKNVKNKNLQKSIVTHDTEDGQPRRYHRVHVQTPSEIIMEETVKKNIVNKKQHFSSETPDISKKYKAQKNQVAQINSSVLNIRNTGNNATKGNYGNKLSATKFKYMQKKTSGGFHALKRCFCTLKSKQTVSNRRWDKSYYGSVNRNTYNRSTSTFSHQSTTNTQQRTSKISKKNSRMPITVSVRSSADLGNMSVKKGKLSSPRGGMISRSIVTERRENKKLMTDHRQSNSSSYVTPITAIKNKKIQSVSKSKQTYKTNKTSSRYNNNAIKITSSISFSFNIIKERPDNLESKINNHNKKHQEMIKKNNIKVRGSRGDYKTINRISSTATLNKTKNAYVMGRTTNSKDTKVVSYGTVTPFSFLEYNKVLPKKGTLKTQDLKKNLCNPLICVDTMERDRYNEIKSSCSNICTSSCTSTSNEHVHDKIKSLRDKTVTTGTKHMLTLENNISASHQKDYSVSSSISFTINLCKGILDFAKIKEDSITNSAHNNKSQKMNYQRNSKRSTGLQLRKKKATKKTNVYAVSRLAISKANFLPHKPFSSNQYKIICSKKEVKKKSPLKVLTNLNTFQEEDSYSSSNNMNSVCIKKTLCDSTIISSECLTSSINCDLHLKTNNRIKAVTANDKYHIIHGKTGHALSYKPDLTELTSAEVKKTIENHRLRKNNLKPKKIDISTKAKKIDFNLINSVSDKNGKKGPSNLNVESKTTDSFITRLFGNTKENNKFTKFSKNIDKRKNSRLGKCLSRLKSLARIQSETNISSRQKTIVDETSPSNEYLLQKKFLMRGLSGIDKKSSKKTKNAVNKKSDVLNEQSVEYCARISVSKTNSLVKITKLDPITSKMVRHNKECNFEHKKMYNSFQPRDEILHNSKKKPDGLNNSAYFRQSFYTLMAQTELEPYECEPGFCIPYQCDPYDCERRIRQRNMYSRQSNTDHSYRSVSNMSHFGRPRHKMSQSYNSPYHRDNQTTGVYIHKNKSEKKGGKRGIRISSKVSINVEIYKKTSGLSDDNTFNHGDRREIKKRRYGSRSYENPSQTDLIEKHSRGSEMEPWLTRCFCTLKLHKAGRMPTKNVQTDEIPISSLITHREAYTRTERGRYGLLPYECEPGVCIPGECDPLECYELIKRRTRGIGVGTIHGPRYSTGSSTYNDRKYRNNWSNLHRRMTDTSNMTMADRRPRSQKVTNPNCVRIGSNISISFELFKSEIPQNADEIMKYDSNQHKKRGHNKSVDSRYSTADGMTQGPSLLKRCFCTRYLHRMRHNTETQEPYVHTMTRKNQTDREIILPTHFEQSIGTSREFYGTPLDPNECEPGFCIPYQCDPYRCEQRIRERQLRSQSIGTGDAYMSYGTDAPREFYRPSGAQTYSDYIPTANKGTRNMNSYDDEDYGNVYVKEEDIPFRKRGIKCSTNIGFSIDVRKRAKQKQVIRNYDNDDDYFEKRRSRDRGLQSDRIRTSDRTSYVDNVLKRCFCTLKLHRRNIVPPTSIYVGRVAVVENRRKKEKFISKRKANSDILQLPAQFSNRSFRSKTNSDPLQNQLRPNKTHQKKNNIDNILETNRHNNDILPKYENTNLFQTETLYPYIPKKINKSKSEIPRLLLKNKKCKCTMLENMFFKKTKKLEAKQSTTSMPAKKNKKTSSMPAVTKIFNYCKNIIWNHNQHFKAKSKKHKKVTKDEALKGKHQGGMKIIKNHSTMSKVLSPQDNDYPQISENNKKTSALYSNFGQSQFVYYARCFCRLNKNTKETHLPQDDHIIDNVNSKHKRIKYSENLKKRSKEKNKNHALNSSLKENSKSVENNTKHDFNKKNTTKSNGHKKTKDVIDSKPLKEPTKKINDNLNSQQNKKTFAKEKNKQTVKFKDETKVKSKTKIYRDKSTHIKRTDKALENKNENTRTKTENLMESNKSLKNSKLASGDRIYMTKTKHGDSCRCCVCLKKRKKKKTHSSQIEENKNLKLPFIEMQVESGSMNILNRDRVVKQIKYARNMNKLLKMSKTEKCVCGSKICGREEIPKFMRQINTEPCICGSEVCKNSITDQYLEHVCDCAEELEKRKWAEKRAIRNKIEEQARLEQQKKEDIKLLKLIKQNRSDCISVTESVLDLCKLLLSLTSSSAKHLCKAAVHPDRTFKGLKRAASDPSRFFDRSSRAFRNSEIKPTCRRVKLRVERLNFVKWFGEKMASNGLTNFIWNINDPKKRTQRVVGKRKKPDMFYNCNLYISTLRKRPCFWVYNKCPWFYPHCMNILTVWKQLTDVLLFLLAILVWSPCIAAMELCRALLCCTFCTG